MKKRIFVFFALVLIVVEFSSFSSFPAQAAERLQVVLDRDYPPFTYFDENGEFKGVSVEFWRLWEKKTGIPVRLVPVELREALSMVRNHEADVIDTIFFTPERAEYLDYVQPLFSITSSVYYRRVHRDIHSLNNLTPFIVGAKEKDALIGIALQENPGLQCKLYADYAEIIRAAKEDEIDVFLMDDPPAYYHLVRSGILHEFDRLSLSVSNHLHVATWKGNSAVLETLRKGLAMFSQEELDALLRPYLLPGEIHPPWFFRLLLFGLGVAALFIFILFLFIYLLRKRVAQATRELSAAHERLIRTIATFSELPLFERQEEEFLGEVLDLALVVVGKARTGSAMMYTEDGGARIAAIRGHSEDLVGLYFPKEDLVPVDAVTIVEDISNIRPFSSKELRQRVLSGCQSIKETLLVPLWWAGRSFGRLSIDILRGSPEHFDGNDCRVMAYFAEICTAFHAIHAYAQREREFLEKLLTIFTKILEYHDSLTRGHSEAAARWALEMGKRMYLGEERTRLLFWASLLHDVGKIFVPQTILQKPGPLTEEEYRLVRLHPVKGAELIGEVEGLEEIARIVYHHHEWWNGEGYPDGLEGEAIPLESRIVAVLDAFEAMTSDRPYRGARSIPEALEELRRWSGVQFDPQVVDIFVAVVSEVLQVQWSAKR